jgi:hypothetical protein
MPTDKLENDRRLAVEKMLDSPRASPKVPVGVRRKAPLQVPVCSYFISLTRSTESNVVVLPIEDNNNLCQQRAYERL